MAARAAARTICACVPRQRFRWRRASELTSDNLAFFHDFPPGTYSFTVQSYGTPTNSVDTLQLTPGMEVYVQVEGVPNWELSAAGGASFVVMPMSPEEGKGYFQIMKNLGQR